MAADTTSLLRIKIPVNLLSDNQWHSLKNSNFKFQVFVLKSTEFA